MREKLGESLASVQKYDAPPENVTTPSLEALQAYSLGYQAKIVKNDYPAAIPFFQRAISLDPNFAMAYARLGTNYYRSWAKPPEPPRISARPTNCANGSASGKSFYIASHYENYCHRKPGSSPQDLRVMGADLPARRHSARRSEHHLHHLRRLRKALAAAQDAEAQSRKWALATRISSAAT